MKKVLTLAAITILLHLSAGNAQAVVNLTITENGSASTSTVNLNQAATAAVTQTNDLEVKNIVDQVTNTGDNSASDNNGNVTIESGDTVVETEIETVGNVSQVTGNCCETETGATVTVSGNGNDSTNSVTVDTSKATTVTVNNAAKITNNISGKINTGNNKANDNKGATTITTGSIHVEETVSNKVNNTRIAYTVNSAGEIVAKIVANGEGSVNSITHDSNSHESYIVNNNSEITNLSSWFANTGGNEASDNLGDVVIKTGDVYISSLTSFESNNSSVDSFCCTEKTDLPVTEDPDDHQGAPTPTTNIGGGTSGPTSGGSNGNNSSSYSGGSVLGMATGGLELPVTGSFWTMWLTILAGILFFIGLYLRLNPGRAPNRSLLSF